MKLQITLAVWLASGATNAFLKKVRDKDKGSDNNGWAQFGFEQTPSYGAYRPPVYLPGTYPGLAPNYASYPARLPLGYYKAVPPLLDKYQQVSPLRKYSAPYPPPILTKYSTIPPKSSAKLQTPVLPHGRYVYPSAYLPAYYMRLDNFVYPPAVPQREPLLSRISKLNKIRNTGYPRDTYMPFSAFGPLGQGQPIVLQQQHQSGFPAPPLTAGYDVDPHPQNNGKRIGAASTHQHPCDYDRYQNVGGKWLEDPPYKYTGHNFGTPVKEGNAKDEP